LLLGSAGTNKVSNHDEAGRDAHPHLQRRAGCGRELRHRLDHGQGGAHSLLGVMLVRPWVAEIGEHPVAHVFGDEATVALDELGAAAMIRVEDAP
jgi:hypothetical protein